MIKTVTQGKDKVEDKELYAVVGEWITSAALADKLGMPIHSAAGDVWQVAIDKKGDAAGFALTRPMKNGKGHVRFLYAVEDNHKVQADLLKAVLKMAKDAGLSTLYTNDRETMKVWAENGFEKAGSRPNSTFVRFEKVLEAK